MCYSWLLSFSHIDCQWSLWILQKTHRAGQLSSTPPQPPHSKPPSPLASVTTISPNYPYSFQMFSIQWPACFHKLGQTMLLLCSKSSSGFSSHQSKNQSPYKIPFGPTQFGPSYFPDLPSIPLPLSHRAPPQAASLFFKHPKHTPASDICTHCSFCFHILLADSFVALPLIFLH